MFDYCPLIDEICAFSTKRMGVYFCGMATQNNKTDEMKECPLVKIQAKKRNRAPSHAPSGYSKHRKSTGEFQ